MMRRANGTPDRIGPAKRRGFPGLPLHALLAAFVALLACAGSALAQDPSAKGPGSSGKASSFPKSPSGPLGSRPKVDTAQPLYLQGDELIYDTKRNSVVARGNVEIYYNNYVLTADKVTYDQSANTLVAEGSVQIREPNGPTVRGERIEMTADFRDAFIQSLSVVGADETRIAARQAIRKDGNITEFEQGKFTPCKNDPGKPPLWCISASRIVHDQQAASIAYQNAQFELFGVPIFYMPYFEHADPSVKQRTGFLAPEIRHSTNLGYATVIPYYFALAPNYDFLFHPMYTSKQGVLWQGDWRHRVSAGDIKGYYTVKIAGIEQDGSKLPEGTSVANRDALTGWRGSVETVGEFSLASWWKFGWDITLESDDTFRRFYKLDSILQTERVNKIYFQGLSDRNYFNTTFYHLGGLMLNSTPTTEAWVHPVVDYNYIFAQPVVGGELSFSGNLQSLSRADGTDSTRLTVEANWRRKIIDGIGQVWTPFARARGDLVQFTNGFDPNLGTSIPEDSIARGIGAVGVKYAFPFVAHTATASHTIEPIGQVIARPDLNSQRRLPDEDAKSLVWDDTLLFDVDKFSGYDRVETGTRANVGLQYTFQLNTGGYARVIAGQSFQLAGTNPFTDPGKVPDYVRDVNGNIIRDQFGQLPLIPNFSERSGLESSKSDYVLGAYIAPSANFRLVSQSRFDENDLTLVRQNLFGQANFGPVNLMGQYSYTKADPAIGLTDNAQELLGQVGLKLTDFWSIAAVGRYDLEHQMLLQDQFIVKYTDECFVLTATYIDTYFTDPTRDIKPDRSIMLRFELKHLGELSYTNANVDNIFSNPSGTIPR